MSVKQGIETTEANGTLDTVKLVLAFAAAAGGIVAYYWFDAQPFWQRVLMVVGGAVLGVVLALASQPGRELWGFVQGSQVELKKMVWPTRQEAVQTTLVLVVFVIILAVIMLGIDWVLAWGVEKVLGGA
jgi:preprotein translocase subunit SecE